MILTIIDTVGIQDYIFRSNKLKHIIGASYLVNCATRNWVMDSLDKTEIKHNVKNIDKLNSVDVFRKDRIEDGVLDAEIIYAGGGNTLILFREIQFAEKFTQELTSHLLLQAPGLNLVISHYQFDWNSDSLGGNNGELKKAFFELSKRKAHGQAISNEFGFGVTAECVFTSLPAVNMDRNNRFISSETQAKIAAETAARDRLVNIISYRQYFDPLLEFDMLGRSKGEKSLMAVVHADGNGMGKRFAAIQEKYPQATSNRDCIEALRAFSLSVQEKAINALQMTIDHLIENTTKDGKMIADEIEIRGDALPIRPIIFGGDDLTFVCDGRIGLSLAEYYLKKVSEGVLSDGKGLYCRAGVAIVKTHFPFSRAYALAEELCTSSKEVINTNLEALNNALDDERRGRRIKNYQMSALDWHFALSGVSDSLERIRIREYENEIGKLTMRPLAISQTLDIEGDGGVPKTQPTWRSWSVFTDIIKNFSSHADWTGHHTSIMELRDALRSGKGAVNNFCENYMRDLPGIPVAEVTDGWIGDHCAYYDAVEALDSHIVLTEKSAKEKDI